MAFGVVCVWVGLPYRRIGRDLPKFEGVKKVAIPTRRVRERPGFRASERFEFLHPAIEGSCCFFNGGDVRAMKARSPGLSSGQAEPWMAEREGFEPSLPVKVNTLSRRADSTTLPPLQSTETLVGEGYSAHLGRLKRGEMHSCGKGAFPAVISRD